MATYKKACMYCQQLIPGDASVCPLCTAVDPFVMRCPKCRGAIERGWRVCSSCGIRLVTICPSCNREIMTASRCSYCGSKVLVKCSNRKCLEEQILTKEHTCCACGKKLDT